MATPGAAQTLLAKDELKRVNQILQSLFENNESVEFRQPVDVEGLGLADYFNIIKTPMDLGTVRKNLKNNKYKFVEEILADIQLIWDNCKTYNAEGSWIWKQADKLEKYSRKLIKNHLPTIQFKGGKGGDRDSGDEDEDGISHGDKLKLTQKIKGLSQEQLGNVVAIVKIIQEECPTAWKEMEKDKYQILVDIIKKETFAKIDEYIDSCIQEVSDQPTKKVKS